MIAKLQFNDFSKGIAYDSDDEFEVDPNVEELDYR